MFEENRFFKAIKYTKCFFILQYYKNGEPSVVLVMSSTYFLSSLFNLYLLTVIIERIKEILKLKKIKFVRVSFDNLDVIQLVENIQREDLSDYEIAKSLSKLKKELNATNKDLSLRLNKSEKWATTK